MRLTGDDPRRSRLALSEREAAPRLGTFALHVLHARAPGSSCRSHTLEGRDRRCLFVQDQRQGNLDGRIVFALIAFSG